MREFDLKISSNTLGKNFIYFYKMRDYIMIEYKGLYRIRRFRPGNKPLPRDSDKYT